MVFHLLFREWGWGRGVRLCLVLVVGSLEVLLLSY